MRTLARFARSASALLFLAGAVAAQLGGDSTSDVPAPRPPDLVPSGSSPARPVASWEGLVARAEPARSPSVMTRSRLEAPNEADLSFAEVPGGIVLGLPARPLFGDRRAVALVERDGELALALEDGGNLALPRVSSAILHSSLRFAAEGTGHWVVDVDAGGSVLLAREFVDTEAGLVAVRADISPLFFLPAGVGVKSNLVDRDVRIALAPDGASARFEADLELRFYRPQRGIGALDTDEDGAARISAYPLVQTGIDANGRPLLVAPPETGERGRLLVGNLSDLAELAGWIGFFRWAAAAELDGLERVRASLAASPTARVSTPRRIEESDRASWVRGAGSAPPSDIPDWMREHAERVSRERAAGR